MLDMTYNMLSGTLNPALSQLINLVLCVFSRSAYT